MEDYYKILEVNENASPEEIKKSFRKLSLKHHPDKPGGDIEVFKRINEAYSILSDSNERQQYDMKRKFGGRMPGMGGMPGMPGMSFGGGGIPEDLLNHIFGNMGMNINMNQGNNPNIRIFRNGVQVNQNQMRKPVPIVKNIEVTLEEVYNGIKKSVEIERWILEENNTKKMEKVTLYIDIPKGTDNNELIILRNKGNIISENNVGDVKVFIKLKNNTEFIRKGLDLIYRKNLSLKEALCGFKFNINLLNGKTVTINNNENVIKPGYEKGLIGYGMERENSKGNLILSFEIEFPDKIDKTKKEYIMKGLE
jgi:DnaJ-class molecular chaperone